MLECDLDASEFKLTSLFGEKHPVTKPINVFQHNKLNTTLDP